jgi:uncharacterized membrane protein YeaQ/YmgE (transglycosylase-associated protein family)
MIAGFFNLIWILIGGTFIGIVARLLVPGRQYLPVWATIGSGIAGMLLGNWLATLLGVRDTGGIDWIRHALQFLVAAGAVVATSSLYRRRATERLKSHLEQSNINRGGSGIVANPPSKVTAIPPTANKPVISSDIIEPPAESH